jgi:hypothetical protein
VEVPIEGEVGFFFTISNHVEFESQNVGVIHYGR